MVFFLARSVLTLLKAGPTILRAKPLFFAAKLSPVGQVIGAAVQGKIIRETVSFALDTKGVQTVIANQILKATIKPLTMGRIEDVDDAGQAVIGAIQDIREGEVTLQGLGTIIGTLATPFAGGVIAQNIATEEFGVPKFLFFLF